MDNDKVEEPIDVVLTWTNDRGLSAQVDSRLTPDQLAGAAWLLKQLAAMQFAQGLANMAQQQSNLVKAAVMPKDHLPSRKRN